MFRKKTKMEKYIERNGFNCYVEEIDISKIYDVFNRIEKIYDRLNNEEMLIFEQKELDIFVKDVVDVFIREYGYLLKKYMGLLFQRMQKKNMN